MLEDRGILPWATRSKELTEAVLTVCSYTVLVLSTWLIHHCLHHKVPILKIQGVSNSCIHSFKRYFSAMKWDRNTICVVFYSLNFLKPVHVQNVHLLPEYSPNNDVKQSGIQSGLLPTEYHWWHVQSDLSVPPVFVVLWGIPCSLKFPKGRSLITISILPKGRSFTANSGTKAAILPKGRSSIANSGT